MEHSHTVRGYCALCTAHCATIATVADGQVTRLEPDHDHPNGGVLCIKGKAAPELVYHPDRLNHPLKRTRPKSDTDPGWQTINWDQALDEIAERIRALGEFAPMTFGNLTSIKDGDPEKASDAMLTELMGDHETLIATCRGAVETADQAGDEATVDLLTQRLAAHEKAAWMLRSTLGGK